jgi:predicted DsbA family dithiol-disulfide isomerase
MDAPRIQVHHATAPSCWFSWGYEAVLNRLRLVYGDQIDLRVTLGCVYEDFDDWIKHYDLDFKGFQEWQAESIRDMGVPIHAIQKRSEMPKSMLPATLAAAAARRQGERVGERYLRELVRLWNVEGKDITRPDVQVEAAKAAGADRARLVRDLDDRAGLLKEIEAVAPHVHVGFYNFVITDGRGHTVTLDNEYDPAFAEAAIDFLSRGALAKADPGDPGAYLREHGATSLVEIARVFAIPKEDALARLEALEKTGNAERVVLAGAPHWK